MNSSAKWNSSAEWFINHSAEPFVIVSFWNLGNAFWFGKEYEIDRKLLMATAWVLYFNSALNPIIYGVFNPEFR